MEAWAICHDGKPCFDLNLYSSLASAHVCRETHVMIPASLSLTELQMEYPIRKVRIEIVEDEE